MTIVITEAELKNTDLMATVDSILNDEAKLNGMKLSAKQMGRPNRDEISRSSP